MNKTTLRTYELLGQPAEVAMVKAQLRKDNLKEFRRDEKNPDFWIVVGGDGTILNDDIKSKVVDGNPVLHVHYRKGSTASNSKKSLGFTADVNLSNLSTALNDILIGKYSLDIERLIDCRINSAMSCRAINEIAIKPTQKNPFSTIQFRVEITKQDGRKELLPSSKCDALIFATKRGASAWNVSLGGPVNLDVDCTIINLAGAPIMQQHFVYAPKDRANLQIYSGGLLSHDSRMPTLKISPADSIEIVSSDSRIDFIRTENTFESLMSKIRRQAAYNLAGIISTK